MRDIVDDYDFCSGESAKRCVTLHADLPPPLPLRRPSTDYGRPTTTSTKYGVSNVPVQLRGHFAHYKPSTPQFLVRTSVFQAAIQFHRLYRHQYGHNQYGTRIIAQQDFQLTWNVARSICRNEPLPLMML